MNFEALKSWNVLEGSKILSSVRSSGMDAVFSLLICNAWICYDSVAVKEGWLLTLFPAKLSAILVPQKSCQIKELQVVQLT